MRCANADLAEKMKEQVLKVKEDGKSTGGIVEVLALNVPSGVGEPVFNKLDAEIAEGLMSIGAVKGVEIGLDLRLRKRKALKLTTFSN